MPHKGYCATVNQELDRVANGGLGRGKNRAPTYLAHPNFAILVAA